MRAAKHQIRIRPFLEFSGGFVLCAALFYGSAWVFAILTPIISPNFLDGWAELPVWKKLVWFSVLPVVLFTALSVLVLKRSKHLGWGMLSFILADVALSLAEISFELMR